MDRKPLVIDDSGQTQRLQSSDALDQDAIGSVSAQDFNDLRYKFALLIRTLTNNGIDLPEELTAEIERL